MGWREVTVKETAAESIAAITWYIESMGLIETEEKFADDAYDFFMKLADSRRTHAICREPGRGLLGYKCITYKQKYTVVFLETKKDLIICEFVLSKKINW